MFSIVIPTMQNSMKSFNRLLNELNFSSLVNEIIIINNKQEQLNLSAYSKVRVLNQQENIYVNPAWNLGVKEAQSEYVAILNDDIFFKKEFLDKVYHFIENNHDCGLIGVDSIINTNIEDLDGLKEDNIEDFHIYQIDNRNYCWGIGIFGKKENFYNIPDDLKVWYGDDYLFSSNIANNKKNYKICTTGIKHCHSLTSKKIVFNTVKDNDLKSWEKYSKEINKENYGYDSSISESFKLNSNLKYDLIVNLGKSCDSLKQLDLCFYKSPFDLVSDFSLSDKAKLLVNNLNSVENLDLDNEFKNRLKNLIKLIKNSKKVCFMCVQSPDSREEVLKSELIEVFNLLTNNFKNTDIELLYIFNERGLEYKNRSCINLFENIFCIRFDYDMYSKDKSNVVNSLKMNEFLMKFKLSNRNKPFKYFVVAFFKNIFSIEKIAFGSCEYKIIKILGFKITKKNKI